MNRKAKIYRSSGNVFADLGVAHPKRVLAKARMMAKIAEALQVRKLTQRQASKILGISQSEVSDLMAGRLSKFL